MDEEREAFNSLIGLTEYIQERNYASMSKFFNDLFSVYSSKIKDDVIPDIVESSYTGIHLSDKYDNTEFLKLIDSFRSGQVLHAKYAIQLLKSATKIHEKFPNISQCNLNMTKKKLAGVVVVGDLHGSFKDLYYIIQRFGIPGKYYRFVFNGDFVDRGPQQCEVLLTLVYAFLMYPSRIFLNRGNHEDLSLNLSKHFNPNFKQDTDKKYKKYGPAVFNHAQRLFRRLPIATIIENYSGYRCFVTHGGISDRIDLRYLSGNKLNRLKFPSITISGKEDSETRKMAETLSDLLWSDPKTGPNATGCVPNTARGLGWIFGEDISESFCKNYGFNKIIRSHEVRDNGISRDHPHCYTIFSSSYYCFGTNKAAVILIDSDEPGIKHHSFTTDPLKFDKSYEDQRIHFIKSFRTYLESEAAELMAKFKKADTKRTGSLRLKTWANILSQHIKDKENFVVDVKYFLILKDYICPCDDDEDIAIYSKMFINPNGNRWDSHQMEFLENVFQLIDLDNNGSISRSEAKSSIHLMNKHLGTSYSHDFLYNLDTNKDGKITLEEFKEGFFKAFQARK